MQERYTCQVCKSINSFTRAYDVTRCQRCGAVYSLKGDGVPSRISPDMLPLEFSGTLSPWMLPRSRPTVTGTYECRFSCGDARLHWDGRCFRYAGKRVQMRTLRTWRGVWRND